MFKLRDFYHLPQLEPLIEQMVAGGPGLVVVAGLEPRPLDIAVAGESFLPSGRSAIFNIIFQEIMAAHPKVKAVFVSTDKAFARTQRQLQKRAKLLLVEPPQTYEDRLYEAMGKKPGLLVIDRLGPETVQAAFQAAQRGLWVLSQFDTALRGGQAARQFAEMGVPGEMLGNLAWVLAVQRTATLCQQCKQPVEDAPERLEMIFGRYPQIDRTRVDANAGYFRTGSCDRCRQTGRDGDKAVFDVFRGQAGPPQLYEQPSLLGMEEYMLGLAAQGHLPLDDLLHLEEDQLRRTQNLLAASERALVQSNTTLNIKLAELEATHRVLVQRTQALFSLQDLGQALITTIDLDGLGDMVCRRASELCGADRAILYYFRQAEGGRQRAEVLAVSGWDSALVHQQFDPQMVFGEIQEAANPISYPYHPPGILPRFPDSESEPLQAGMLVPLVAQDTRAGLMIVHSTQKNKFAPGEVALLQTFANQAALAIQRAGLVDELRAKIAQLEATQAELVQKERLEREMELARQVQQSMLPRTFPKMAKFAFAAQNMPARQVGGDFYDVVELDEDHLGVFIGDVTDKGMPAALYMALNRSLLRAEARRTRSPMQALTNINHLLLELGELAKFVSIFYGVIQISSRRMRYCRAGHERPLLLRQGAATPLDGSGSVLGILDEDELHLSEEEVDLAPGDRLVLYTDGLTDVADPGGNFYGREGLVKMLLSHAHLSPEEICEVTFADLASYQGSAEQFDDMTLLVMAVK